MKTKFSLLFYIRKPKNYVSGSMPVWVRITVNGKRAETSSDREREPTQWNSSAGRQKGTKEDVKSFNAYLDDLQSKVYKAHRQLIEADVLVTAETIRNKFMGKTENPRLLLEIFTEHNKKMAAL